MARSATPPSLKSNERTHNGQSAAAAARRADEDVASMASYIADMASELSQLAGRSEMPMVAYFLNLARVEAELRSRELGGLPLEPGA